MRVGWRKSEKEKKSLGFNPAALKITVHGVFLVFLQNYSFATRLSNSVYRTILRFFDVPNSFLMLFEPKNLYFYDLCNHFYIYHSYTLI